MSSRLNRNAILNFTMRPARQDTPPLEGAGYVRGDAAGGIVGGIGKLNYTVARRADNNAGSLVLNIDFSGVLSVSHNVGGVAGNQWVFKTDDGVGSERFGVATEIEVAIDTQTVAVAVWDDISAYVVPDQSLLLSYLQDASDIPEGDPGSTVSIILTKSLTP